MINLYSKYLVTISILLLIFQFSILNTNAQCTINSCSAAPIIASDDPFFDYETNSIQVQNVMFGNFGCSEENFKTGAVLYVYQLLPNGERISNCTVTDTAPNNFVARVLTDFGQASICDMPAFNFGTIPALPGNGFEACDGAVYEIEIVLYITELDFDLDFAIQTQLPATQYLVKNLGNVAVNYTDEFPTNADPLTTASIKTFPDGQTGTVEYACGEVLRLDVAALSRLANCPDFEDIFMGVPSELYNEFYYSIDGKAPVILQNQSTGATGGQLTGPIPGSDKCYAGLLGVRAIEFDELEGIVDGSRVVFTVSTTDVFTDQTAQDQITIIYTGENCMPSQSIEGCTEVAACNYNPDATINDGSCLMNDCLAVCGGAAIAGSSCDDGDPTTVEDVYDENCVCAGNQTPGCTEVDACNYDPNATINDGSCLMNDCLEVCGGTATAGSACDDGDPTTADDVYDENCVCSGNQTPGCTEVDACNYDPNATINDGSCLMNDCLAVCGGTATAGSACDDGDPTTVDDVYDENCVCTGLQVPGCTEEAACNYNPDATIDDESCRFESYYFNCNCEQPCPAGFNQDEACNCNSQCPPAPNAGEDTALTVCENDAPFNLFEVLNGTPDEGGEWYFQNKSDPLGAITDYIFTPGTSEDGVYLYFHWQGDECENSSATVTVTTNTIVETSQAASICEGENYTLPNGEVVSEAGSYESIFNTVENCDSIITTLLTVNPLDCLGICDGINEPGSPCILTNGCTGLYNENCECLTDAASSCTDEEACNYNPSANPNSACFYPDCNGDCCGSANPGTPCDDEDPDTENDVYKEDCTCAGTPITGNCSSQAGTLVLAEAGNFADGNYVCFGATVQIQSNDFVLDVGQSQYYVFHTLNINADGSFPTESIIRYSDSFINELGQVNIYATAVGAVDNGSDQPDFNDPCIVYSNTIELNLLSEVTIAFNDYCNPSTSEYSYTFEINGGLPAKLSDESYIVTGDYFNGYVKLRESNTVGPLSNAGTYNISVTDDNGCSAALSMYYDCSRLPISLVSFLGEVQEEGDLIEWVFASELNIDYYTLQYSTDGVNFVTIAQIDGAGTISDTSEYEFFNTEVVVGFNYYRLLQTDFDNTTFQVGVIELNRIMLSIENSVPAADLLNIYPLPAENMLHIEVENYFNSQLNIFNAKGQKISVQNHTFNGSNNLVTINVEALSSGLYIINIVDDDGKVMAAKFIKQ